MKPANESSVMLFLYDTYQYNATLKDPSGKWITSTTRKTAFKAIYEEYVKPDGSQLSYLLMYKLSQDHLEPFFAAVRSSNGFNNNPTIRQFIVSHKRMLVRHDVKGAGAGHDQDPTGSTSS